MATSPYINHFIQPDSIIPNPANPQSFNRYSYVQNNPIKYSDPTGHDIDCGIGNGYGPNCTQSSQFWIDEVSNNFSNVSIDNPDEWQMKELKTLFYSLDTTRVSFNGNHSAFETAFGDLTFEMVDDLGGAAGKADSRNGHIRVTHSGFQDALRYYKSEAWVIVHEMAHVFDKRWAYDNSFGNWFSGNPEKFLSNLFVTTFNGGCDGLYSKGCAGPELGGNYIPSGVTSDYGLTASDEDFAESFAAFILSDPAGYVGGDRKHIIKVYIDLMVTNYP